MTTGEHTTVEEARRHEAELNERQRHVLDLLTAGRTNPEIAEALGITLDGAKWNVSEILTKLGFATREEAAGYWRWRNRPSARLGRAFRALLALPAVKLVAGGGLAATVAGVGIAAWLLFSSGSEGVQAPRVPPFELEALVTVVSNSTSVGTSITGGAVTPGQLPSAPETSVSILRWWFRKPDQWRWDIEQMSPSLSAHTLIVAASGDNQLIYDSSTNTVTRSPYAPVPGGYVTPPAMSFSLGPLPFDTMDAFIDAWRHTGNTPKTVGIVGVGIVLGRKTTIVEMGPTSTSSGPDGKETTSGTVRVWIDPERMFVMRGASGDEGASGQSYSMEVTSLRYGVPAAEVATGFTLPKGAREVAGGSSTGSTGGGSGIAVGGGSAGGGSSTWLQSVPGFLKPSYVPAGYAPADYARELLNSNETVAVEETLRDGGASQGSYLRIQQRKRADGLPASLRTSDRTTINNHDAYRGTDGAAKTLAWEQDGIAVLLTADALAYDELERIAASMTVQ